MRLKAEGLAARYASRTIFTGVEFSLQRGECLVVVGSNGAGKSTLLRILAGLIRPHRGVVSLQPPGEPEVRLGRLEGAPDEFSRWVGLASLDVELYGELTAIENLQFFARVRGLPAERSRILESLNDVGLAERADERISTFSSGMRQRLRLLFALQAAPPLLLLDEPGSNLDEVGRALVVRVVEEQLLRGIVVVATNDPGELQFGTQILQLGH